MKFIVVGSIVEPPRPVVRIGRGGGAAPLFAGYRVSGAIDVGGGTEMSDDSKHGTVEGAPAAHPSRRPAAGRARNGGRLRRGRPRPSRGRVRHERSGGYAPLVVHFHDASAGEGIAAWAWDVRRRRDVDRAGPGPRLHRRRELHREPHGHERRRDRTATVKDRCTSRSRRGGERQRRRRYPGSTEPPGAVFTEHLSADAVTWRWTYGRRPADDHRLLMGTPVTRSSRTSRGTTGSGWASTGTPTGMGPSGRPDDHRRPAGRRRGPDGRACRRTRTATSGT